MLKLFIAQKTTNLSIFYKLLGLILLAIIFLSVLLLAKRLLFVKRLSDSWETYSDTRLLFKVKVPPGTKTRIVPAGFDNGMGFGEQGISRIEFYNDSYLISVDPSKNARNDKTVKSLSEVRDFNGINNVAMGVCCSGKNETTLPNGSRILLENHFSPKGEKYGISATLLGKKFFYNIGTGSIYQPNLTSEEETIFLEFIDTFRPSD